MIEPESKSEIPVEEVLHPEASPPVGLRRAVVLAFNVTPVPSLGLFRLGLFTTERYKPCAFPGSCCWITESSTGSAATHGVGTPFFAI